LTPNDHYIGRTAPLTSKCCILYIYATNIGTECFKHGIYSPVFPLQNTVCFIILTCFIPVLFTFYIQGVLKLKINSGAKRLISLLLFVRVLTYGVMERVIRCLGGNYVFYVGYVSTCGLVTSEGIVLWCHTAPTFTAVTSPKQTSFSFPNRTDTHKQFICQTKILRVGNREHCVFSMCLFWIGRNINVSDQPTTSLFDSSHAFQYRRS
jgi:hypothetical protein